MFASGVAIRGRLFPFELSDPLVGSRRSPPRMGATLLHIANAPATGLGTSRGG